MTSTTLQVIAAIDAALVAGLEELGKAYPAWSWAGPMAVILAGVGSLVGAQQVVVAVRAKRAAAARAARAAEVTQ